MDTRNNTQQRIPPNTSAAMDPTEELPPDVDEPPDERAVRTLWTPGQLHFATSKVDRSLFTRRESLLTRQLHSETEQTDEEDSRAPPRTLSTQSTWSNPSVASTAELTSDDGHSVASPAISPPLPPTAVKVAIPITEKPLAREPHIIGQEEKMPETGSEKSVEAGLGRKRCISFACGNKDKKPPTSQPAPQPVKQEEPASSASPPKRKCMLKFVCPSRPSVERKVSDKSLATTKRPVSPPPPERKASASAKAEAFKAHRGSDSTVTHASPKNSRKSPAIVTTTPTPTTTTMARRKLSNDSDASTEATRFHEFASSDGEPEEWVQESTCHRSRLTVSDTLKKENILRKACEEVEEEAVEEEEDEEAELEDEDDEDDEDGLDEDDDQDEEEEESDDGFRTDDEEGFAESDSEGEESDEEWWRPGGISTAATSVDHLERLTLTVAKDDPAPSSSVASVDSSHISPRAIKAKSRRKHHSPAVPIKPRSEPMDLPDSTDFVCGTLDEDRPLEQAFLNQLKLKEAAKHKARPQDIDPTFPTSDPEMDEEDDEDLEDSEESERENLMHGELDELDGDFTARHRAVSPRTRTRSNSHRSPPPPRHRSPPPPRHRSPAPAALKRQGTARSPPPPTRRGTARSPPPRKLFGQSPKRSRSPAPVKTMTSPPNTRRTSPISSAIKIDTHVLASRPQLTHTASLPRGGFKLGKMSKFQVDDREGSDTERNVTTGDVPKRGAIDIYKGLEKKRQRRKEKLYQKMCAKAAAKGEKAYKVKPGKGAERMRELGLELQRYHGKGEHILSM
ncbi:hypothetical protein PRZ48_002261 [Zasmidium cellare]|uniref:Uncharacterized protein n=1 Tax=Zasmidium cellare TaxID=395010 RepID=A0ABR0F493_ZASCE|nr:hypothetical protein PRZ48_002261 [Zasmidium cellare]